MRSIQGMDFIRKYNFWQKVEENNIQFIGPSKKTMELMGDKITARQTVDDAGVPVIPGSKGAVNSVDEIKELVKKLAILLFKSEVVVEVKASV